MLEQSGLGGAAGLSEAEAQLLRTMMARGLNTPVTTSMGRLFDAVAALTGVASANRFEGQAPMRVEAAIAAGGCGDAYPVVLEGEHLEWSPVIEGVLRDVDSGVDVGEIARRFHETAARWVAAVARQVAVERVVLSGGVFQNAYLAVRVVELLEADGFRVFTHQRVPPNDGGIALGQCVLAAP
jgi:hydrogenase maturation protein HypF